MLFVLCVQIEQGLSSKTSKSFLFCFTKFRIFSSTVQFYFQFFFTSLHLIFQICRDPKIRGVELHFSIPFAFFSDIPMATRTRTFSVFVCTVPRGPITTASTLHDIRGGGGGYFTLGKTGMCASFG